MKKTAMREIRENQFEFALNERGQAGSMLLAVPGDDVRWALVARLKAQIEAGTYAVSSEALAERLMEPMGQVGLQGRLGGDV